MWALCYNVKMKTRGKSLSYWTLLALEKATEGFIQLDDFIYHPYKYRNGPNLGPSIKRSSLVESIRRLRETGYIQHEIDNEKKVILKLTTLGKEYLGMGQAAWDGKYRVVIWDIPENKLRIRDLFRRRLRQWGFTSFQRSVWVSKRDITQSLRSLISELGIGNWVVVIETDDPSLSGKII